jgi:hypothetical protein
MSNFTVFLSYRILLRRSEQDGRDGRIEYTLRVFENRIHRKIFGPERDDIRREWRRLHNKEFLCSLLIAKYNLVIKSRTLRWAGHVERMGENRGAYRALVGET